MAFQEGFNPFGGINKSNGSNGDNGGTGGGVMYVTVSGNDDDGYTADKTYSEIETAHNDGVIIVAKDIYGFLYPLTRITDESFTFANTSINGLLQNKFVLQVTYLINSDNEVIVTMMQYPDQNDQPVG